MEITYSRTVEFFAAHFNETAYPKFQKFLGRLSVDKGFPPDDYRDLVDLLIDIHGHNFRAEITVHGFTKEKYSGYLISDEVIAEVVNEWAGINVSMHKDFLGTHSPYRNAIRATTENMANMLAEKISRRVLVPQATVLVKLYEADGIWAQAQA
jgi:6-pyruvoyl-tetrahydropterin synthase